MERHEQPIIRNLIYFWHGWEFHDSESVCKKVVGFRGSGPCTLLRNVQNSCPLHRPLFARRTKKLWRDLNGHVCGFLGKSPEPPRSRRAILFGALLTAVSPLFAASGRVKFRVIDPVGDPVPKAAIAVLDREDKDVQSIETDESGEGVLTGLPLGDSRFGVTSPGFEKRLLTLTLHNGKEVKVEVHISVPIIGTVIEVKPKPPRKRHGWLQY